MWTDLDFRKMGSGWKFYSEVVPRLTDEQLRALLLNTNSKRVTRYLSLRGCTGVTGLGLEPLRGSRTLEVIDLRLAPSMHYITAGDSGLEEKFVLSILSSMPPFTVRVKDMLDPHQKWTRSIRGLSQVLFRPQHSGDRRGIDRFNSTIRSCGSTISTRPKESRLKWEECSVTTAK